MHPRAIQAPDDVRLTPLKTISTLKARVLLTFAGVDGIPVANAVDCYRIQYSMGSGSEAVQLSGLLALPRNVVARRLVSFQHGTSTTRTAVPSQLDGTGLAAAIAFAGNGYALLAPDYPGLGESPGRHPYYVADAIGPAVAGMIEAVSACQACRAAQCSSRGFRKADGRASRRFASSKARAGRCWVLLKWLARMTFDVCRCPLR